MKKDMTLYTASPVQNLLNAVVLQAAEDYRSAFMKLLQAPDDRHTRKLKKETEAFFLSPEIGKTVSLSKRYAIQIQQEALQELENSAPDITG